MSNTHHKPLGEILDKVDEAIDGDQAPLGEVLSSFGDRAFGPVLTMSGLFLITPLGAIPGAPVAFFIIIASFAIQLILGRSRPWLPKTLNELAVTQDDIDKTRKYIEPALEKIDLLAKPRLAWAATKTARYSTALLSLILAFFLLPLSAIPFGAMIPAILIALLGMGMMARDGLLLLTGFSLSGLIAICLSLLLV